MPAMWNQPQPQAMPQPTAMPAATPAAAPAQPPGWGAIAQTLAARQSPQPSQPMWRGVSQPTTFIGGPNAGNVHGHNPNAQAFRYSQMQQRNPHAFGGASNPFIQSGLSATTPWGAR